MALLACELRGSWWGYSTLDYIVFTTRDYEKHIVRDEALTFRLCVTV